MKYQKIKSWTSVPQNFSTVNVQLYNKWVIYWYYNMSLPRYETMYWLRFWISWDQDMAAMVLFPGFKDWNTLKWCKVIKLPDCSICFNACLYLVIIFTSWMIFYQISYCVNTFWNKQTNKQTKNKNKKTIFISPILSWPSCCMVWWYLCFCLPVQASIKGIEKKIYYVSGYSLKISQYDFQGMLPSHSMNICQKTVLQYDIY